MPDDGIKIGQYVPRRYSQHLHAVICQPCVPLRIALRLIAAIVRLAIDLDRKSACGTKEIEYVPTRGMLFAEAQSAGALP